MEENYIDLYSDILLFIDDTVKHGYDYLPKLKIVIFDIYALDYWRICLVCFFGDRGLPTIMGFLTTVVLTVN